MDYLSKRSWQNVPRISPLTSIDIEYKIARAFQGFPAEPCCICPLHKMHVQVYKCRRHVPLLIHERTKLYSNRFDSVNLVPFAINSMPMVKIYIISCMNDASTLGIDCSGATYVPYLSCTT